MNPQFLYIVLSAISVLAVITLLVENNKLRKKHKELEFKFKANPSFETQQLLSDLLRGDALFHISRIAPEDVLIRRQ